jgi:L-lysine 2,3-aminomutase
MAHLDGLSPAARRLYQAMVDVADRGICKANQRQLRAITSQAFKTIIVLRDELVAAGVIERYMHKRGRRDWYKIVPVTELERREENRQREVRRAQAVVDARDEHDKLIPLFDVSVAS